MNSCRRVNSEVRPANIFVRGGSEIVSKLPVEESVSAEQFAQKWSEFLAALEVVSRRKLRSHNNEEFRKHLEPLLTRVFNRLRSEEGINSLRIAVAAELEDPAIVEALSLLHQEMEFYVAWQGVPTGQDVDYRGVSGARYYDLGDASQTAESDNATDDAIGAGKTIKDSAEKLITKLPRPLQYILKILNEILSILRGGS